jgi:hypothetical protein
VKAMAGKRGRVPEASKLLHGPYTPQPLRRGDRATCLFRDGDVVINPGKPSVTVATVPPKGKMPAGVAADAPGRVHLGKTG